MTQRASSKVTVYCGSSGLVGPELHALAAEVGAGLASRGLGLVYGGASVGLMGTLANAALKGGGQVVGVITRQLMDFEVAHQGLSALHVVESMHERKELMSRLGDGFLVLPGGFGTLDELFEAVSWRQLGLHDKPVVLLDHDGFFSHLQLFLDRAMQRGLLRPQHRGLLVFRDTVDEALEAIEQPKPVPPAGDRWWMDGVEPPRP